MHPAWRGEASPLQAGLGIDIKKQGTLFSLSQLVAVLAVYNMLISSRRSSEHSEVESATGRQALITESYPGHEYCLLCTTAT